MYTKIIAIFRRKVKILHLCDIGMIRSKIQHNKPRLGLSHRDEFRLKIILFGLVAGLISSIGISTLIVMVEKVTSVPAGAFYLVFMLTITQTHSYSIYMIVAGLLLHFAAGSFIGVLTALPFVMRVDNKRNALRLLAKYAPVYGLCFGFALWLVLFIPITYSMMLPALNNMKGSPMITQQDPTGRVAFLVIGDVLSMQNRVIIGALAFNMFYGLVTAIIINSLCSRYLINVDRDRDKDSIPHVPVDES
jgi:hypothetical protein